VKIALSALAFALTAACAASQAVPAQPAPAGSRAQTCIDSVTGNAAMPVAVMRQTEQHYWPDPKAREAYRLTMLQERMGAYVREGHPFPQRVDEFAPPVAEVPWLSTCDPWGHRVRLSRTDTQFDLRSAGPDGVFDTEDDIFRSDLIPRNVR
jgi:hypothetical protein